MGGEGPCDCKACRVRDAASTLVDAATNPGEDMVPPMLGLLQAAAVLAAYHSTDTVAATRESLSATIGQMYEEAVEERLAQMRVIH